MLNWNSEKMKVVSIHLISRTSNETCKKHELGNEFGR